MRIFGIVVVLALGCSRGKLYADLDTAAVVSDGSTDPDAPVDTEPSDSGAGEVPESVDEDDDGYTVEDGDCDDTDAAVHPDAEEVCNGIDDDCDGAVDETLPTSTWYADDDGDGYGDAARSMIACMAPDGYVALSGDCDDSDLDSHPAAIEICDYKDNDCDSLVDEDATSPFYQDMDGDGYGNDLVVQDACEMPVGYTPIPGDCDEFDPLIHPEAAEICNGIDDDCDGEIDEDTAVAMWYRDADADGFGDEMLEVSECDEPPEGYVGVDGDCDDDDATVFPDAAERCDGIDNDCDGDIDEDASSDWYADADGDGAGDPDTLLTGCDPPTGYVASADDCDDDDATRFPGAVDGCNGIDDDCDGDIDEAPDLSWFADADSDGAGDAASAVLACTAPSGYVADANDCDDTDATVHPGADESCNDVDDDCDGDIDEDATVGTTVVYPDADGDGFGEDDAAESVCERLSGHVEIGGDCDDDDPAIHPDADERCDEVDNDCDGAIDADDADLVDGISVFTDADEDGYGDSASAEVACEGMPGVSRVGGDCDDDDPLVHPAAIEECDGWDNDCDGLIDPEFLDSDGDGIANCVDETVYEQDFDSGEWGDWSSRDLGGSNPPEWSFTGGRLRELSNAANAIAHSPNLGALDAYTVSVDMMSAGTWCHGMGMGFAEAESGRMLLIQWMDPNDDYGWYSPGGHIRLAEYTGSWSVIQDASWYEEYTVDFVEWATLSVEVDGSDIRIYLDDELVILHRYTGTLVGPGRVSVWTWDADNGVYFDNVAVTQP